MRPIPRFWSTAEDDVRTPAGVTLALRIWGWSTTSLADAATVAAERLEQVRAVAVRGERLESWAYYPRLPLREETLAEVTSEDGTLLAVVTRNRYGAEVLNTDLLLIADVDLAEQAPGTGGGGGLLRRLFGKSDPDPAGPPPAQTAAVERIERFAAAHPDLGVHTYRTAAGLRVLVTGGDLPPGSSAAESVLRELDSDPVYVLLCSAHETYRARLTPKPWRCGWTAKPVPWPYTGSATDRAARWLAGYTRRSEGVATTRRLSRTGPAPGPDEARVIALHDHVSRADQDLPLA